MIHPSHDGHTRRCTQYVNVDDEVEMNFLDNNITTDYDKRADTISRRKVRRTNGEG